MDSRSIMVFDGDVDCRGILERFLENAGHRTEALDRAEDLVLRIDPTVHAIVITDLAPTDAGRFRRVEEIVRRAPAVPLLVVVDHDEAGEAVKAMKAGAFGYMGKPYIEDQVLLVVNKTLEQRRLQDEVQNLRGKARSVERPIICESHVMRRLIETVDRVATSDATVLVVGDTGTGKELLARRIHARSRRSDKPFVAISCAALPAASLEAELFGHVKGAYTGADQDRPGKLRAAEGGTLFLDEISELPIALQGKLLRVLQERTIDVPGSDTPVPIDVRFVTATNRHVRQLIAKGEFRDDLFYRLNVVEIRVPPLRARREDIPLLARHFLRRAAGGRDISLPDEVLGALSRRPWPGNVRELRNVCERLVILAKGQEVRMSDLPRAPRPRPVARDPMMVPLPLEEQTLLLPPAGFSLVDLERRVIERALELKEWNISETARYLRIHRHILNYRIFKHGLRRASGLTSRS